MGSTWEKYLRGGILYMGHSLPTTYLVYLVSGCQAVADAGFLKGGVQDGIEHGARAEIFATPPQ